MQPPWDDLRIFLAVARGRSFARAAKSLAVDDTTVSRRVRALERAVGHALMRRAQSGAIVLTSAGADLAARAERMEKALHGFLAMPPSPENPTGTVRLTAVPMLANRVLVPALLPLTIAAPRLKVELVPDLRDFDLNRREADLAVRLARPKAGGARVLARRIGTLRYGGYVADGTPPEAEPGLGWIAFEEGQAHLPPARWLARMAKTEGMAQIVARDAETMIEAAAHGLGRALLPCRIGDRDARLRPVRCLAQQPPEREVWLLSHRDPAEGTAVRAIKDWLMGLGW